MFNCLIPARTSWILLVSKHSFRAWYLRYLVSNKFKYFYITIARSKKYISGPPGFFIEDSYFHLFPVNRAACPHVDPFRDITFDLFTKWVFKWKLLIIVSRVRIKNNYSGRLWHKSECLRLYRTYSWNVTANCAT